MAQRIPKRSRSKLRNDRVAHRTGLRRPQRRIPDPAPVTPHACSCAAACRCQRPSDAAGAGPASWTPAASCGPLPQSRGERSPLALLHAESTSTRRASRAGRSWQVQQTAQLARRVRVVVDTTLFSPEHAFPHCVPCTALQALPHGRLLPVCAQTPQAAAVPQRRNDRRLVAKDRGVVTECAMAKTVAQQFAAPARCVAGCDSCVRHCQPYPANDA